jgi:spore coat polysaccharide biosynthesis predicted glycosyltransferase SpsG
LNNNRNILICPLEWGLGHAARMIPLAIRLREMNNNIILGAGEEHLALFRRELPGAALIDFPGFKPCYSRYLPQYLALLLQTPLLMYHIIKEHARLKQIVRENKIDIVISDNRFGLWNNKAKTVYVTHLPVIPLPPVFFLFEFIGILLHRAVIKKFNYCFIPDLPGEINVSGRLSHGVKLPANTRFIGLLSRFTEAKAEENDNPAKFRHNTVILSGPEPQRGLLRKKVTEILKKREVPTVFLGGSPDKPPEAEHSDNIVFYNHLLAPEMKAVIAGSEGIITRSGYTTIMELISLNRSALLIPTPGQTEQEYLARYLEEKGWFRSINQKELNSGLVLTSVKPGWTEQIISQSRDLLEKALKELSEE